MSSDKNDAPQLHGRPQPLFQFKFTGKLDRRRVQALRDASGMRISLSGSYMREPGQGQIGTAVFMWLAEGAEPETWEIGARTHRPDEYDSAEVERRREQIRTVLPEIADSWEEIDT